MTCGFTWPPTCLALSASPGDSTFLLLGVLCAWKSCLAISHSVFLLSQSEWHILTVHKKIIPHYCVTFYCFLAKTRLVTNFIRGFNFAVWMLVAGVLSNSQVIIFIFRSPHKPWGSESCALVGFPEQDLASQLRNWTRHADFGHVSCCGLNEFICFFWLEYRSAFFGVCNTKTIALCEIGPRIY